MRQMIINTGVKQACGKFRALEAETTEFRCIVLKEAAAMQSNKVCVANGTAKPD